MASRRPSQVVASIKARCCLHASVQKKALPSRRSDSRSRLTSRGGAVLRASPRPCQSPREGGHQDALAGDNYDEQSDGSDTERGGYLLRVVRTAPSSATKIASRLAGSVVLAFALTR